MLSSSLPYAMAMLTMVAVGLSSMSPIINTIDAQAEQPAELSEEERKILIRLTTAIALNNFDNLQNLLQPHIHIHNSSIVNECLHHAALFKRKTIIEYLRTEAGADLNYTRNDVVNGSILHATITAEEDGYVNGPSMLATLKYLLDQPGINVDIASPVNGNTPLHYAYKKRYDPELTAPKAAIYQQVIDTLLNHGASSNIPNNNGETPEQMLNHLQQQHHN